MMTISVPTKNVYGETYGQLYGEVSLKFMWDLVGSIPVGNNGVAYVVDRTGKLIAHGDASKVLRGEDLSTLPIVAQFMRSGGNSFETESGVTGITGNSVVATYVPLVFPDWAVVTEVPVTQAYSEVTRIISIMVGILFLIAILIVILGTSISRLLARPIIALRNSVEKMSHGDIGTTITIDSQDEIGDLAEAFNNMSTKLKISYTGLEEKVRSRTNELQEKMNELERMNKLMIGRELKMTELKQEIVKLKKEIRPTTHTSN
jgi:methyl-accepting chemotaxis protein